MYVVHVESLVEIRNHNEYVNVTAGINEVAKARRTPIADFVIRGLTISHGYRPSQLLPMGRTEVPRPVLQRLVSVLRGGGDVDLDVSQVGSTAAYLIHREPALNSIVTAGIGRQ
jgi:hypothetical protein